MQEFFDIIFSSFFVFSVLRVTTPILFAALGALVSAKAGVINIGLEGIMMSAALMGVIGSWLGQNPWVGLLFALCTGVLLVLIMAYFALHLHTNVILAGIAVNILAAGGTVFLLYLLTGSKGISSSIKSHILPDLRLPVLDSLPWIGNILSGHNILTYLSFISVLVVYIFVYKSRTGLHIRAVGENMEAARSVAIPTRKIQYIALLCSGLLASLGGAYMSMGYVSWFAANITAGRGFIGLAAAAMGPTPLGTLFASLFFGFADALSNAAQSLRLPSEFVRMIPYISTIIGITIYSSRKKSDLKKRI